MLISEVVVEMSSPSENPKFKLQYFNTKSVGEPIRFLFAYAGQDYEDVRVSNEDWPSIKSCMFFSFLLCK